MAVERGKNRYSVSLSPESASSLKERASSEGVSLSALLAQIVDEHFIVKETLANYERDMETVRTNTEGALQLQRDEYEAELRNLTEAHEAEHKKLREQGANVMQRARDEFEKKVRQIAEKHEAEAQQLRAECEKRAEEAKQLEGDVERLEGITKKLDSELKASEASRKTVEDGFQHRIELLEKDKAKLEAELQTEKVLSNERKADKENLQKQLELVTLRLPAPRVGFWARLFGKKEA
jgi:hypothetical protein